MRQHLVDLELPVRPAGGEGSNDVDVAARSALFTRSEFVGDRAVVGHEQGEMIWRFLIRCRHRRRTAGRWHFGSAVWIRSRRRGSRKSFARDCDEHGGIIWLISDGTRLAVLDPEIGPVVYDL